MGQVIVMGHGGYAKGVHENLKMIVGAPDHMHFIDLAPEEDLADFQTKVDAVLSGILEEEILFACDLMGASPFRVAALYSAEHTDRVVTVSGLNAMAYMELSMNAELPVHELANRAIETTKQSVGKFPE